jgi:hypothetical protein
LLYILRKLSRNLSFLRRQAQFSSLRLPLVTAMLGLGLLGMLREENRFASRLLVERGLQLNQARILVGSSEKQVDKRSEIRSGSGAPRSLMPLVQFFQVGSAEPMLTHRDVQLIPRTGDTVVIRHKGGTDLSYRVQDVEWQFGSGRFGAEQCRRKGGSKNRRECVTGSTYCSCLRHERLVRHYGIRGELVRSILAVHSAPGSPQEESAFSSLSTLYSTLRIDGIVPSRS